MRHAIRAATSPSATAPAPPTSTAGIASVARRNSLAAAPLRSRGGTDVASTSDVTLAKQGGARMAKSVSTERALKAVDEERDAWEAVVTEVGEDRLVEAGAMGEKRTFKDLAAHLAAWMTYDLDKIDPPESPTP